MSEKPQGQPEPISEESDAPPSPCEFENCNRIAGHRGPHGFEVEPGLIFAPYGGGEGRKLEVIPVALKCDCCQGVMRMQPYEAGGATFTCQNCSQRWSLAPDGRASCTTIARMYPSKMDEASALYQEFLTYRLQELRFRFEASVLAGVLTQEQADRQMAGCETEVAKKRRQIAARLPRRVFSRSVKSVRKRVQKPATASKEKN